MANFGYLAPFWAKKGFPDAKGFFESEGFSRKLESNPAGLANEPLIQNKLPGS